MKVVTKTWTARFTYKTGQTQWSDHQRIEDPRELAKDFALHMGGLQSKLRPDLMEICIEVSENGVPSRNATVTGFHKKPLANDQTLVFKLGKVLNGSRRYQFERDELQPMFNRMVEFLS